MAAPARWKWWAAAAAVALGLLLSSDGVRNYWKRRRLLGRLERKLEELRKENDRLEAEIRRLKTDPQALERHARRELGLVKPGEIEYRFIEKRGNGEKKK